MAQIMLCYVALELRDKEICSMKVKAATAIRTSTKPIGNSKSYSKRGAAYPLNEITPTGICIKCFVCSHICCDFSNYFFADSIFHWYGSYLQILSHSQIKSSKMRAQSSLARKNRKEDRKRGHKLSSNVHFHNRIIIVAAMCQVLQVLCLL